MSHHAVSIGRASIAAGCLIPPAPSEAQPHGAGGGRPREVNTGATKGSVVSSDRYFWSTSELRPGEVAIDWLTLTTFDPSAFAHAVRLVQKNTDPGGRRIAKFLQYEGMLGDGYFWGKAFQEGRQHYVLRVSGLVAMRFFETALVTPLDWVYQFKATRIDVQYTHPEMPEDVSLSVVRDDLRSAAWEHHRGARPKIGIIDMDDGLPTLYIGSRKESVRYQRIYVKQVVTGDGELKEMLRWEVEYKQELAQDLWMRLLEVGASARQLLAGVLLGEMAQVPVVAAFMLDMQRSIDGEPERLKLVRSKSTEDSCLAWLFACVAPALRRLQGSKDERIRKHAQSFLASAFAAGDKELPPSPDGLDVDAWLSEVEGRARMLLA